MRSTIGRDQLRRAFADTVRILRLRIGLSQENLAYRSGVDRAYMGNLEREKHTASLEIIYRLLPVLGISFVEFAAEFERVLHSKKRPQS
jgi:transcriptional regulator with XRE-family HTH domain